MIWEKLDYSPIQRVTWSSMMTQKRSWLRASSALIGCITVFILTVFTIASGFSYYIWITLLSILSCGVVTCVWLIIETYQATVRSQRSSFGTLNEEVTHYDGFGLADHQEGILFIDTSNSHQKIEQFSGTINQPYSFGNYMNKGYIRLTLSRKLPNIILDAKSNNFIRSNLPSSFDRSQVLSLESNFDTYYTVYAPDEYKVDALYVFTPDVMQLLIESGARYDIEVIDNSLYLYHDRRFQFNNPATFKEIFWLIEALSSKLDRQTGRYRDDSIGNKSKNLIATDGKVLLQTATYHTTVHNMSADKKALFNTLLVIGIILGIIVLGIAVLFFIVLTSYNNN